MTATERPRLSRRRRCVVCPEMLTLDQTEAGLDRHPGCVGQLDALELEPQSAGQWPPPDGVVDRCQDHRLRFGPNGSPLCPRCPAGAGLRRPRAPA